MDQDGTEVTALRALAHPVRLRILSLLTGAAMSAAELARELDVTHANASYHVRFLLDAGLLVEAGEEKIRGGVAKRYRHPWDRGRREAGSGAPADGPSAGTAATTGEIGSMAAELVRRFALRSESPHVLLADAELWVEPGTWDRVWEMVRAAAYLLHEEARPPHAEGTMHVNLTAAAFTMREDDPDAGRPGVRS